MAEQRESDRLLKLTEKFEEKVFEVVPKNVSIPPAIMMQDGTHVLVKREERILVKTTNGPMTTYSEPVIDKKKKGNTPKTACPVCRKRRYRMLVVPCRHRCCIECLKKLELKKCAYCGTKIESCGPRHMTGGEAWLRQD